LLLFDEDDDEDDEDDDDEDDEDDDNWSAVVEGEIFLPIRGIC